MQSTFYTPWGFGPLSKIGATAMLPVISVQYSKVPLFPASTMKMVVLVNCFVTPPPPLPPYMYMKMHMHWRQSAHFTMDKQRHPLWTTNQPMASLVDTKSMITRFVWGIAVLPLLPNVFSKHSLSLVVTSSPESHALLHSTLRRVNLPNVFSKHTLSLVVTSTPESLRFVAFNLETGKLEILWFHQHEFYVVNVYQKDGTMQEEHNVPPPHATWYWTTLDGELCTYIAHQSNEW